VPVNPPSLPIWAQTFVLVASPILAALAWLAKLQWSKEHIAAKDATIAALESHIKGIASENDRLRKDLQVANDAPSVIKKFYDDNIGQYKEAHLILKAALDDAVAKLKQKDGDMLRLLQSNTTLSQGDKELIAGRNELQRQIGAIQLIVAQVDPSLQIDSAIKASQGSSTTSPQDPFGIAAQMFGGAMNSIGWVVGGAFKNMGIG
jgi:hypothetical protein